MAQVLTSTASRQVVEQYVHHAKSLTGNQFCRVLSAFPGPMNRVILNKLYSLKPQVPTSQLPQVFYLIAQRQLDSALPPFLLQQFETSDELANSQFSPAQDCQTLYSLAKLATSDTESVFSRLAAGLAKKDLSSCTGKDLSLALWALASSTKGASSEVQQLADHLAKELSGRNFSALSGTDFAKSVHSLSKFSLSDAAVKQKLVSKSTKHFFEADWRKNFSPQEFTAVICALAPQVPYSQHDRLWENVKQMLMESEVLPSWNATFQQRAVAALELAAPQLAQDVKDRIALLQQLVPTNKQQEVLSQLQAKAEWEAFLVQAKADPEDDAKANADVIRQYADKAYSPDSIDRRIAQFEQDIKQRALLPTPVGHLLDMGLQLPKEEEEKKEEQEPLQ